MRYSLVGVLINLGGYVLYLTLTLWGVSPKMAMSLIYVAGVFVGYFGHKNYSFRHSGNYLTSGVQYLMAHAVGYIANFLLLSIFSEYLGFPHQVVQAFAIVIVAYLLFLLFRFLIFSETASVKQVSTDSVLDKPAGDR